MSRSKTKFASIAVMIGASLALASCVAEATDYGSGYPAYYYDGPAPYGAIGLDYGVWDCCGGGHFHHGFDHRFGHDHFIGHGFAHAGHFGGHGGGHGR